MLAQRFKAAITSRASGLIMETLSRLALHRRFAASEVRCLGPAVHTGFQ